MKKLLLLAICFILLGNVSHAASVACPTGSDEACKPYQQVCNPDTKLCMPMDSGTSNSTQGIGGACQKDSQCTGQNTLCLNNKCAYDPASTQTSNNTPPSNPTPNTSAAPATGLTFVPLTQLPGIRDIAGSANISALLNTLYKLCIGAAALLAVFQIIWAGIIWMSAGDSSEKITKARGLISGAIFGLILVLSPYIIFSIVNPGVLNINFSFSNIQVSPAAPTTQTTDPNQTQSSSGLQLSNQVSNKPVTTQDMQSLLLSNTASNKPVTTQDMKSLTGH